MMDFMRVPSVEFGLLFPKKTGVYYEAQTAGIMCSHPIIEGFFIPLDPERYDEKRKARVNDWLTLADENYDGKGKLTLRQLVKEYELPFKLLDKSPKSMLNFCHAGAEHNDEAWQWVEIKSVKKPSGLNQVQLQTFAGKRGVFVYFNSD